MKKSVFIFILLLTMSAIFSSCRTKNEITGDTGYSSNLDTNVSQDNITEQMAYDGVYNYCRSTYNWNMAEDNSDIMYVMMGKETETEYQVIFRSYTGAFVYFYIDKSSGNTRLSEYVPALEIEEEAGTINLYDYLESDDK